MQFTVWQNALWLSGLLLHSALLAILIARSFWRTYPVFVSLIAFEVIRTIVLFLVSRSAPDVAYTWTYWIFAFLDYVFQAALVLEIAHKVLCPAGTWVAAGRVAFAYWCGLSILTSLCLCFLADLGNKAPLEIWQMRAELFTSFLTCELYMSMSFVAYSLRLLWKARVMAIGHGLAVWALIALAGDVEYLFHGSSTTLAVTDTIRMLIYLGVLIFWSVISFLPVLDVQPSALEVEGYLIALRQRLRYPQTG